MREGKAREILFYFIFVLFSFLNLIFDLFLLLQEQHNKLNTTFFLKQKKTHSINTRHMIQCNKTIKDDIIWWEILEVLYW